MLKLKLIHKDKRGRIYILVDGKREMATVLETKKGYARGGCVHNQNEFMAIFNGKVEFIPKNIPHCIISKTNSVILEGKTSYFKTKYNKKFRQIVDKTNDSAN